MSRARRHSSAASSSIASSTTKYELVVSDRETKYGRSRGSVAPPETLRRHYPNAEENNYWFAYESKEMYYPIMLIQGPGNTANADSSGISAGGSVGPPQHPSKVVHLEKGHGVEVCMTITAQGNGPQAEPAVIRTAPVKDIFWFKAIKSFIFGKIELRFEVINKSGYLNSSQLPDPLVYVIDVSVDIHGNKAPDTSMLVGLGDGSYYDYVYDESRSSEEDGDSDVGGVSDGDTTSNLRSSSRVLRRKPPQRGTTTGTGAATLSKYEAGTVYDRDYISKPRYSYASGGNNGGTSKRPRYTAGGTGAMPMPNQDQEKGRKVQMQRSSYSTTDTSATYHNSNNRSISPSPESVERAPDFNSGVQTLRDGGHVRGSGCSSSSSRCPQVENPTAAGRDDQDITVIEQIYYEQEQVSADQTTSIGGGANGDDASRERGVIVTEEYYRKRLPRFRSYSRDPGDIEESEVDGGEDGDGEEWVDPFAGEDAWTGAGAGAGAGAGTGAEQAQLGTVGAAVGEGVSEQDMKLEPHFAPSRSHLKQPEQPQRRGQGPAQEQELGLGLAQFDHALLGGLDVGANKNGSPLHMKVTNNADIASRSISSSKTQERDVNRSHRSRSATATASEQKSRTSSLRSHHTQPKAPSGTHLASKTDDQWDFLDPLQSPEQAYLRINNLLNVKSTQQSLLHATEVSSELEMLLKQSRDAARSRNGGSRKTEAEIYYKTMAQRLEQLQGMLEARKALDSALLSLLNQGCSL